MQHLIFSVLILIHSAGTCILVMMCVDCVRMQSEALCSLLNSEDPVYPALRKCRSMKIHIPGVNLQHHARFQFTMTMNDHPSVLITIQT